MLASYRKRISAMAIQLAKDDPQLVKEVIARLRKAGDIEADDLVHLERIAARWIRRIVRGANDAKSWGWQHPFGLGHFQGDLLQQIRPFFAEYVGPCGQRRLDVGLRSHAVEVDSEFSEILDFGGCEPE